MNRTLAAVVALATACGGKKSDDDEAIAKLRSIADAACACSPKDKACAEKSQLAIEAFDGELGKKLSDSSSTQKTIGALRDRFFRCVVVATVGKPTVEPAKPVEPPKPVDPPTPSKTKLDVAKLPPAARREVTDLVWAVRAAVIAIAPDIGISSIRASYVGKDGTLDPTYGKLEIEFARSDVPDVVDDPDRPTGAPIPVPRKPVERTTEVCPAVTFEGTSWTVREGTCAKAKLVGPRCTLPTIWARAIAQGAPERALAQLSLRDFSRGPKWHFTIKDDLRKVDYKRFFDDDCSPTDKPEAPANGSGAKPNPFDNR